MTTALNILVSEDGQHRSGGILDSLGPVEDLETTQHRDMLTADQIIGRLKYRVDFHKLQIARQIETIDFIRSTGEDAPQLIANFLGGSSVFFSR